MRKQIIAAGAGLLAACSMPLAPVPSIAPASAPAAAAVLAGTGRYPEAVALLEAEAQRRPDAALLGNLGYVYYLDGRLEEAQAALERACLLAPSSALAWERLAALMEAMGDTGRALDAMRQARMLREQAVRRDEGDTGTAADDLWPADMARIEVRQVNAGLVEVARVEGRAAQAAAPARLEVSNGNGIRGMAAAVAQRLRAQGMQVVRLTNTIPFNVEQTRIEIRGSGQPQLRIVLGKDLAPEIKKPPGVSRRQAP